MSDCPYCRHALSPVAGRTDCPHCRREVFNVACPGCGRPTLNLTLLPRDGQATCFACRAAIARLPEFPSPTPHTAALRRLPPTPVLPAPEDAAAALASARDSLARVAGLEALRRAPDLHAVVARYLTALEALLALDARMTAGEVTTEWLRRDAHLDQVIHGCFTPGWPAEGMLLPPAIQSWLLLADEVARRWQYARRLWLDSHCGLKSLPVVPGVTTANPAWHRIDGDGPVVTAVLSPGFLLRGDVVRRARVRT